MTLDRTAQHGTSAETGRTVHALIRALTAVRRQHNVAQVRLAERLAVTETTMAKWESGADDPSTMNLLAWADALGCTVRVVDTSAAGSSQTAWRTGRPVDGQGPYHPLARALRAARERADLRQQDIANKLDVSLSAICQWESADRIPHFAHLTAWANTLGCLLELNEWNPAPAAWRTTDCESTAPHAAPPAYEPIWPPETSSTPSCPTPRSTGEDDTARETRTGRHHVTVPALLTMASTLREAVARILADHPRRNDAQQIIGEFGAVPLLEHRCTCCPPAPVTLTVDHNEQRVRLEINYHLALHHPPRWSRDEIDNYGLGLAIINGCTDRWGTIARQVGPTHYADKDLTWWAELDHTPPQPDPLTAGA